MTYIYTRIGHAPSFIDAGRGMYAQLTENHRCWLKRTRRNHCSSGRVSYDMAEADVLLVAGDPPWWIDYMCAMYQDYNVNM